jgi:hypothetical protein
VTVFLEDLDVDERLIFINGSSRSGVESYEVD